MHEDQTAQIKPEQIVQITLDYHFFNQYFCTLQQDILLLVQELLADQPGVREIIPRKANQLKKLESVRDKLSRPKHKDNRSLFELHDIAGVRVVCYSRHDRDIIFDNLVSLLPEKGYRPEPDKKLGDKIYHAAHIDVSRNILFDGQEKKFYCEIQIKSLLEDTWAVLDERYVKKMDRGRGERQEVSKAVSEILLGCDTLWDHVEIENKIKSD